MWAAAHRCHGEGTADGRQQRQIGPPRLEQAVPRNLGHEGLQLLRLIGACEGPAHIAGGIPDIGAYAAGTPLLLVGQRLQDHGDHWAEETETE